MSEISDQELAGKVREIARAGEKRVKQNRRADFPRPDDHILADIALLHTAADRLSRATDG
jgi:hypothetical protein